MGREADKVGVFINDVPVEFIGARQWSLMRGVHPATMEITATDDRFSALENPVRLRIITPGADGTSKELIFERLYLLQRESAAKNLRTYLLADFRWLLGTVTLTAQYNIRSYGGKLRELSTLNGQAWSLADAIENAMLRLIKQLALDDSPRVLVFVDDIEFFDKAMPDNLGNSEGGGWVGAKLEEFFYAMVGDHVDLTMSTGGDVVITGRSGETLAVDVASAPGSVLYDGTVAEKDVHWQTPRQIVVLFEKRLGGLFRIIQEKGTQVGPSPDVIEIENVIPQFTDDVTAEDEWVNFPEFFANLPSIFGPLGPAISASDDGIRKNIMKPRLFNDIEQTAPDRATVARVENLVRTYWRNAWRVLNTEGSDDLRKRLADIRLGSLQKDGTTNKASVFGDYVIVKRWQGKPGDPLSENMLNKTAPFVAEWRDLDQLVFFLAVSETISRQIGAVYLGSFNEPIGLLPIREMIEQGRRFNTEDSASFSEDIDLGVYYHGLYVGEEVLGKEAVAPVSELFTERLHRVSFDGLFPNPQIAQVEVMSRGITANFRRTTDEGVYELLNQEELFTRANFLAGEIRKTYEQERAGLLRFGGVGFMVDHPTLQATDEVNSVTVTVGMNAGKEYEIVVVVDVRPEVRVPTLAPVEPMKPVSIL